MRIISFKGQEVFGYLDFDIKFNSDISFLIGSNGSGKTTVLQLIRALLTPSFKQLCTSKYSHIEVEFEYKNKREIISSSYSRTGKKILQLKNYDTIELPDIDHEDILFHIDNIQTQNFFRELMVRYTSHPLIKHLEKIGTPTILGLDRRVENNIDQDILMYEKMKYIRNISEKKRMMLNATHSMQLSLLESEVLVQQAYKKVKQEIDEQSQTLIKGIVESSFNYMDARTIFSQQLNNINKLQQQKSMLERKDEIETAISKLFTEQSGIKDSIATFFSKLEKLFLKLEKAKTKNDIELNFEWIINLAQIERIQRIITILDDNTIRTQRLFYQISRLINTMNNFFQDSSKEIEIDTVGHIQIKTPNKISNPIECLSSGEKQLLIIFVHAIFNLSEEGNVFIIDEPELSLHMKWQEMFVDELLSVVPDIQLIIATHSPEIVGNRIEKTINLKGKN